MPGFRDPYRIIVRYISTTMISINDKYNHTSHVACAPMIDSHSSTLSRLYLGESEVDWTGPARDVGALLISRCEKGLRRADGQFIIGIC
jgi:hypothetical protein